MDRTDCLVIAGIVVFDVVVGATAIALDWPRPGLVVAMVNMLGAITFMILAGINLSKIGRRS